MNMLLRLLLFAVAAPFACAASPFSPVLDGKPLATERLFAPLPGEVEWSDNVSLARAEVSGSWTLTIPDAAGAILHPPQSSTTRDDALVVTGNNPARFGIELPDRRLLVFIDPPSAPNPTDAKSLPPSAASAPHATAALQALLDAAKPSETVLVPPGRFTIGTIFLRPGVCLHLARGATLVASLDASLYPELPNFGGMKHALVVARSAHGASLTGSGEIDAQGHRFRRTQTTSRHPGIRLLAALDTRDLTVEDVTLRDAYAWTGHFQNCQKLRVRSVAVLAEINFPGWNGRGAHVTWNNADGLNPDGCRDVLFEDLFLHTGDDGVAVKNMDAKNRVETVTVRRAVIWTPVAALKIGTESRGETMRGIHFENIYVAHAGRAMALDIFDCALASDITFRDITVARCEQGLTVRAGKRAADQTAAGRLADLTLENIRFLTPGFPPAYLETPHSTEPLGRINVRGWSAAGRPAADAAKANFRKLESAPELLWGTAP